MEVSRGTLIEEIWPILTTIRLLGWFPAQRNLSGVLVVKKSILLYSCIIIALLTAPASHICYKSLKLTPIKVDQRLHFLSYMMTFFITASPQIIPVLTLLQVQPYVTFLNKLEEFQLNLSNYSQDKNTIEKFDLHRFAVKTVGYAILPFILSMATRPLLRGVQPQYILDLYLAYACCIPVLLAGSWIAVTSALCSCSQLLVKYYEKSCCVLAMRPLWLQLCQLMRDVSYAMYLPMTATLIINFAFLVCAIYELKRCEDIGTTIFFSTLILLLLTVFITFCSSAYRVNHTIYQDLLKLSKVTKTMELTADHQRKMIDFFSRIGQQVPTISCNSYFTLGRSFISAMTSALLTNLVVLLQFQIEEKKLTTQDFFTLSYFLE